MQEVYEVPKANITVFREGGRWSKPVTGANVRKAVVDACASSVPGDSLMFFFAGFGTRVFRPPSPCLRLAVTMCSFEDVKSYDQYEYRSSVLHQSSGYAIDSAWLNAAAFSSVLGTECTVHNVSLSKHLIFQLFNIYS
ncbi:MAG: hypothetical protein HC767_13495 [Akkermansiaceae bacterium]|nr:hypothetical protein [Akkermansiaceae bacterium]